MLKNIHFRVCFFILCIQHFSRGNPLIGDSVRRAREGEFPYIVSLSLKSCLLRFSPQIAHKCGGTLITRKHVLTAAHCVEKLGFCKIVAKVNNTDLKHAKKYEVKKCTTYDESSQIQSTTTIDDIAVLELKTCVNSSIKPAILANIRQTELRGRKAVTAGWGLIENKANPRNLRTAEVDVLTGKFCPRNSNQGVVSEINATTHKFLCTTAVPPIYTDAGDSGNPLIIGKNQIIGVNGGSTAGDKDPNRLSYYLSVEYYQEFIRQYSNFKPTDCKN